MSKKSHHFLTLWPWPLTYDLEKLIRSGHYHYQCVYQIWEQSIPWFLSYRVNTIAGGGRRAAGDGRRAAGGGRLRRKTITSPDPSDTGDIINYTFFNVWVRYLVWNFKGYLWNSLRWRHNEHDGVSNHQRLQCLLNCWFRRRSKKTSKLRVTGLCVGNSPETGEFPAQMTSYAENVSIWWRHHVHTKYLTHTSKDVIFIQFWKFKSSKI